MRNFPAFAAFTGCLAIVPFSALAQAQETITKEAIAPQIINKEAIGPFKQYCDGYGRPGAQGIGYVSVLKVSTGVVEKTDDLLLDDIVAYDRAEANDAYIGQINMETASSFCGVAGQIWGYDIAVSDDIEENKQAPLFSVKQYDGSDLQVYDAAPLMEAGKALFGTEKDRRFPPAPGAHVICANKSVTSYRPKSGEPDSTKNESNGVWSYIAISISKNREKDACLFIEDAGLWTKNDNPKDLEAFLDKHRKSVLWSITACGKDQSVLYDRTYISYAYVIMEPGQIGTALTVAPYIVLAQDAVPRKGFSELNTMTLKEWEKEVGFE
ncbi:MAG: histidine decarboxylase, pyruvoyl type [Planctomycetes bacterium]|jgi:histidine decarboxylase|nr:histidine decarboxylase, pyruvoyl type [Planctomycetota bacterium]MDP6158675.1 histidine decarboxylase, pyruvoyl type [Phycisphaerales bacterium]|tara:strand:- start:37 stop:1011 length:975 start_codon:yes stop_codon:yes gene_type:complete